MADISQNDILVKAGSFQQQSVRGTSLKVIKATGEFYIRLDSGDLLGPLNSFDLEDEPFESVEFYNETANDIEIRYYFGDSKIKTNDVAFIDAIEVKNPAGQQLNTYDAACMNRLTYILQVMKEEANDKASFRPAKNKIGAQYASIFNIGGSQILINPAVNTNGLIVRNLNLSMLTDGYIGRAFTGNILPPDVSTAGQPIIAEFTRQNMSAMNCPFVIPAGQGLYTSSNTAAGIYANVTYDFL